MLHGGEASPACMQLCDWCGIQPVLVSRRTRCVPQVVVFDQATKLAHCVTWVHLDQHADVESAYRAGRAALRALTERLSAPQQQLPAGRVRLCVCMLRGQMCWISCC